jgi:phage-related protein (TIGR01555 family)
MAKGFQVSELSGDDMTAFEAEMVRLKTFRLFADAGRWARLYGGALLYMQINDGRVASEPVDESRIVNVHALTLFTSREISVSKWGDSLGSDCYGMPEVYRISSWGKTFDVHHSRVLRFEGIEVDREALRHSSNDGFGGSVVDQVWDSFEQYGTTHAYLNGAVSKINQGVLKLKGLSESAKGGAFQKIADRLRALIRSMSVIGDIVIDADAESYEVKERSMTGFSDAASVAEAHMIGTMGVPKSLLMMQAPGGLANGDNGGDWTYWAMHCGSVQLRKYEPEAKKLTRYIFLSANSPVIEPPQYFTISWQSIRQMTEMEKAQIYSMRATGRASDLVGGVITAIEARDSDDVVESYHLDAQPESTQTQPDGAGIQPPTPAELRVVGG